MGAASMRCDAPPPRLQTISHVRMLLERGEAGPVTFIMLVGGFAESKRLQRTLMLNFQASMGGRGGGTL